MLMALDYQHEKESYMISAQDVTVVLVIAVVLFGVKKLPELGQGIGEAIKNFKKGLSEPSEIDVTPKKEEPSKQETEKNATAKS
jgi:sec-independent protein translocase protein TatA